MSDLVQKIREVVKEFGLLFYSLEEPGKHPLYFLLSKDRLKLAEIRVSVFPSEDFMLDLCRFPDWLSEAADEIERLRGSCDKATVDLMNMGTTISTLREAIQAVVDDLDSNDSEVCSREWFGTEPKVIVRLRDVLLPKETP